MEGLLGDKLLHIARRNFSHDQIRSMLGAGMLMASDESDVNDYNIPLTLRRENGLRGRQSCEKSIAQVAYKNLRR
jgi:hypothetical protein